MSDEPTSPSLALLTDLYQLTMGYGYWKVGLADRQAVFHLTFRTLPFHGGYAIAAGLDQAVDLLRAFRFDASDLAFLATLAGNDGRPLFDRRVPRRTWRELRLAVDVDAVPEGTAVFPHEPLVRVRGPMLHCQLLETPLLTIVNFATLVATKAARVCRGRRAATQCWSSACGGPRASTAGCPPAGRRTSAVSTPRATCWPASGTASPSSGTHAHSWVMSFDTELESFEAYAAAMPNNCVFLVDTYDTLDGVRHAAAVGQTAERRQGHKMVGIRLDSGDLAYLSIEARKILDAAGLADAAILASNDLDERLIASLKDSRGRRSPSGASARSW